MTDIELTGIDGSAIPAAVAARAARAAAGVGPRVDLDAASADALTLTWADLKERHETYDLSFLEECRALYAGGPKLLKSKETMDRLFRKNPYEDDEVYTERRARAHYFPYAGTILDQLVAGLGSDPLTVSFAETDDKGKRTITADGQEWERWISDVACSADMDGDDNSDEEREGGTPIHEFMLEATREAEQTRCAWILVALPDDVPSDGDGLDAAGADAEPYLKLVPSEQVIDWEVDDTRKGDLEWVCTMSKRRKRDGMRARRHDEEMTFTVWTRSESITYVVIYNPDNVPKDDQQIKPTLVAPHPFGVVPFVRFELPEGMHGMGKMHSLAREHFNKRSAMAWAEYKALFPILYEYNGSEESTSMPIAAAQRDANRSTNQVRGQGYSQLRGSGDKAEWVGPDPLSFTTARESCNDLMREMHRVMFSMAQSANMDAAALQRSGKSKEADSASTDVLLDYLGGQIRSTAREAMAMAARGRGVTLPPAEVSGLAHFDSGGVADAIAEALEVFQGIPIKSKTFSELYLSGLYAKILGDRASQEQRETIRQEIADATSAEEDMAAVMAGMGGAPTAGGKTPPDDPEDPGAPGEDTPQEVPAKPAARPRSMIATRRPKR